MHFRQFCWKKQTCTSAAPLHITPTLNLPAEEVAYGSNAVQCIQRHGDLKQPQELNNRYRNNLCARLRMSAC